MQSIPAVLLVTDTPCSDFVMIDRRAANVPKTVGGILDYHFEKGAAGVTQTRAGQNAPTFHIEVLWDPIVSCLHV